MGYRLRRQLREVLGPDIAGLQRAVALEIADDANDDTRKCYAALEDLRRWTAAKDVIVVRNALKRLAAAGWEFRVPIGRGRDGRVLYAVPGVRMTFRVPDFKGVATATPTQTEGVATATPEPEKGEPELPIGVATAPSGVAPATPFSSIPSEISSPPVAEPVDEPAASVAGKEERQEGSTPQAFLEALPAPWGVGRVTAQALAPRLAQAAEERHWRLDGQLVAELTKNSAGINNYASVLRRRIDDLPYQAPTTPAVPRTCAECGQPHPNVADNGLCPPCIKGETSSQRRRAMPPDFRQQLRHALHRSSTDEPVAAEEGTA